MIAQSAVLLCMILVPYTTVSTAKEISGTLVTTAELVDRGFLNRIKGRIITGRNIHYTGDSMEIKLRFPQGAEIILAGEVDAYLVIFTPQAEDDAVVVPVSSEASFVRRTLFKLDEVDISTLPAGWYQLGLMLTVPGGSPLDINDWHNGLKGLLHTVGIVMSDEAVDYDLDGDGLVDDDDDSDGFTEDTHTNDDSDIVGIDSFGIGSYCQFDCQDANSDDSSDSDANKNTDSNTDSDADTDGGEDTGSDTSGDDSDADDSSGSGDVTAYAPLLGRGDVYMPSRQADFFFSNGDSFSSTEIQNHMREKFNRYYTEPDWAPIRTIYVSPNGSQPIASNSASNPSSVNDAVNALEPGDLIHFLTGTYNNFNVRLWEDIVGYLRSAHRVLWRAEIRTNPLQ